MIYVVTSELYPTNLRSQALGFCSMVARIFGLLAPFLSSLTIYWQSLPMLLLGIPTLVAAVLVIFFITETSGEILPQNMKEGKELGHHV